jgi:hypothetical protein
MREGLVIIPVCDSPNIPYFLAVNYCTVRDKIREGWSVYPLSVIFISGPIYVGEGAW